MIGAPFVVARTEQGTSSGVRHVASDGVHVSVLLADGESSAVELWSIADGRRIARHALTRPAWSVRATAVASDAALAVDGGQLVAMPFSGAAPSSVELEGWAYGSALSSIGGADLLPTGATGDVLIQAPDGTLALHARSGALRFRHEPPQRYLAPESRNSVASISPSGERVIAAVGADAIDGGPCIQVFDRAGALVRHVDIKCAKNERTHDVALDDEGWIGLATSHRTEVVPPEGFEKKATKRRS